MKKMIFLTICLMLTSSCFSLLAPLYESVREITLILDDPRLEQSLGAGQTITTLVKTEEGYEIETDEYRLQVAVTRTPPEKPGPVTVKFDFKEAIRLK